MARGRGCRPHASLGEPSAGARPQVRPDRHLGTLHLDAPAPEGLLTVWAEGVPRGQRCGFKRETCKLTNFLPSFLGSVLFGTVGWPLSLASCWGLRSVKIRGRGQTGPTVSISRGRWVVGEDLRHRRASRGSKDSRSGSAGGRELCRCCGQPPTSLEPRGPEGGTGHQGSSP